MGLRSIIKILTDKSNPDDYEITSPFPRTENEKKATLERALSMAIPQSPESRLRTAFELVETTSYLETYFSRYDEIKQIIEELTDTYGTDLAGCSQDIRELVYKFKDPKVRTLLTKDFIDRAISTGKGNLLKQELWKYSDKMTLDSLEYAEEKLGEISAPIKSENEEYVYCSVEFESSGREYYYLSDDNEICPGDEVIVPVGNYGKESKATVVAVELLTAYECPISPAKLKRIIKHAKNEG